MAFQAGDRVRVVARDLTSEDAKTGLYHAYFGGLAGKVDRTYGDGSVCVEVDLESLSEEMRKRHLELQEAERKRWLDDLSDEARNRLSPEQKQLRMSYKILVSKNDIEVDKGGRPAPKPPAKAEVSAASSEKKGPARAPDPGTHTVAVPAPPRPAAPARTARSPKRLSEADLAAREEEFLASLQRKR